MHLEEASMKRMFESDHGHDPAAIYKFNHQSHCSRPSLESIITPFNYLCCVYVAPSINWEMLERRKMIRSTKALL